MCIVCVYCMCIVCVYCVCVYCIVYSVYILTLLIIIVISYYQVHAIDDVNMTTPYWPHPSPCLVGNTGPTTLGTQAHYM